MALTLFSASLLPRARTTSTRWGSDSTIICSNRGRLLPLFRKVLQTTSELESALWCQPGGCGRCLQTRLPTAGVLCGGRSSH